MAFIEGVIERDRSSAGLAAQGVAGGVGGDGEQPALDAATVVECFCGVVHFEARLLKHVVRERARRGKPHEERIEWPLVAANKHLERIDIPGDVLAQQCEVVEGFELTQRVAHGVHGTPHAQKKQTPRKGKVVGCGAAICYTKWMQWTFVTSGFPWPLTSGTWLRVFYQARALVALGDAVRVLACTRGDDEEGIAHYQAAGVEVQCITTPQPAKRARAAMGVCVFDPEFAKAVSQWASQTDVMVLQNPGAFQYAPEARACECVIADLGDDPALEERRKLFGCWCPLVFARRVKFLLGWRRDAKRFSRDVDAVVMVSDEDRDSFARRHRSARVETVPGGVEVDYFSQTPAPQADDPPTICFTGNYSHPPNCDAAEMLARAVAPEIWKTMPEVRVVLAGGNPPPSLTSLAGDRVVVTGFVDDLRDWLGRSHAVVLPMRIGTGVKNKLLEAWAARKPVVCTTLATQGIAAVDGENLLVADTPATLAAAAVKVLQNSTLAERLADNGYGTVVRNHSWDAVARCYRDIAHGLVNRT